MTTRPSAALAALLISFFLLAMCGCTLPMQDPFPSDGAAVPEAAPEEIVSQPAGVVDTIKIAYNNTDSLNPYLVTSTVNANIMPLIYDSIVKLDRQYKAEKLLAENITLTPETCTVTIRGGVKFSNGAALTSADVVYSAAQVMTAGGIYGGLLANVAEVTAPDERTVIFTLKKPDVLFESLLTFPIVCEASPDIGSGRYILSGSGENMLLTVNPLWFGTSKQGIKTISLINQLDSETFFYSLKLGTINYAYSDLSGNEVLSLGISTQSVPLNNLIYLGINSTKKLLSDIRMRQVINSSLSRTQLADGAYAARAVPAYTPFNPVVPEVSSLGANPQSLPAAASLMAELGYEADKKDAEGYYTIGVNRVSMRLLVNNENLSRMQLATDIQRQMKELGIEIIIDSRTFAQYTAALATWDFDLYIGEVKLYNNRDITELITNKGSLGFGAGENAPLSAANASLMSGALTTEQFVTEFNRELPFLPLMYRSGMVAFSRDIHPECSATEQDIFYNIENW